MVGLTLLIKYNLISPFCDDKSFTTAAPRDFRFQCETFDNQFDGHFILFFNLKEDIDV